MMMKEEELFTESSKETASRIPPLGLGYLAAYLEREGHEVKIWDGFFDTELIYYTTKNKYKIKEIPVIFISENNAYR